MFEFQNFLYSPSNPFMQTKNVIMMTELQTH